MPNVVVGQERDVADAGFSSSLDSALTVGAFIVAVYDGRIQLDSKIPGDVVSGKDLGNGTVEVLSGGIGDFPAIYLDGTEIGKLFGNTDKRATPNLSVGLSCGVDGA